MFERFTERARQVVVQAQATSAEFQHPEINTLHLLSGIVREEEGLAARVLAWADVGQIELEPYLEPKGDTKHKPGEPIPFTPDAKRALEVGLREALSLGHNYIGTEHLLLGLIRIPGPHFIALAEIMDDEHPDEKLRDEIIRMLSGPREKGGGLFEWVAIDSARADGHRATAVVQANEAIGAAQEAQKLGFHEAEVFKLGEGKKFRATMVAQ